MQTSWKKVLVLPACGAYFHAKFAILRIKYERWEKRCRSKYWYQCCQFCPYYKIMEIKHLNSQKGRILSFRLTNFGVWNFTFFLYECQTWQYWAVKYTQEGILFESNRLPCSHAKVCAIISRRLQTSFNNLGEGSNLIATIQVKNDCM